MRDREDLANQPLGYLLHRLAAALRTDVTASVLDPLGLTFAQYICMRLLSHRQGSSNADLAREVMVSPQAMNVVVRGLQDRGLVTRPAEVPSGRSRPAELTQEGAALLARIDGQIPDSERRVLAPLSDREQRDLRRLLAALD